MVPLLTELSQLEVEPLKIIVNTTMQKQRTDLATISSIEEVVDITEITTETTSPDLVAWVACCCCCCCELD